MAIMRPFGLAAIVLLWAAGSLAARSPHYVTTSGARVGWDRIDALVTERMAEQHVAGFTLGLISEGRLQRVRHFGHADHARRRPIDDATLFEAASMTKPVFAWLVLRLVEQDVLELDRPLWDLFPYPDLADQPEARLITARHVLTHATGLPNWRYGRPLRLEFTPGTDFEYSGEGFVYLARTLEHVTGETLEQLAQREVFRPLGMTHSTLVWSAAVAGTKAVGHYNGDVRSPDPYRPLQANPAASLLTTVEDFGRFMEVVLAREGLAPATYAEMLRIQTTPPPGDSHQDAAGAIHWGLGWVLEDTPWGLKWQHGGNNGDFESYFELNPARGSGYVYFTNSDQGDELNRFLGPLLTGGEEARPEAEDMGEPRPFTADTWEITGSHQVLEIQGRESLAFEEGGIARLRTERFENLLMDFHVNLPADACRAGLRLRVQGDGDFEHVYLRSEASGTNRALQYTPVFHGSSGWQIHRGANYARRAYLRHDDWTHVRVAVFGDWMEVYIDDMQTLALHVFDLKHPVVAGGIALSTDAPCAFADVRVRELETYDFVYERQPKPLPPPGTVVRWLVSDAFAEGSEDLQDPAFLASRTWTPLTCEYDGLLNLARVQGTAAGANTVAVRTVVTADEACRKRLQYGFSDVGKLYLNGRPVCEGQRMAGSRDDAYLGTLGLYDAAYLDLEAGANDLVFVVTEHYGGWGLLTRFDDAAGLRFGLPGKGR